VLRVSLCPGGVRPHGLRMILGCKNPFVPWRENGWIPGPVQTVPAPGQGCPARRDVTGPWAPDCRLFQLAGLQNSATGFDLGFYAARWYSWMRPPRIARRLIRCRERSAPGWPGRGGRAGVGGVRGCGGPSSVAVPGVLCQDRPQMPFTEDQRPVGDLCPGGEHQPFRVGVRTGAPGRDLRLWVPKTCATWADVLRNAVGLGQAPGVGRASLGQSGGGMIFGLWA
jgi:hypothetical protein